MSYPSNTNTKKLGARIASVELGSAAQRAGLEAGDVILSVEGNPLRDILDWYWYADGPSVELEATELRPAPHCSNRSAASPVSDCPEPQFAAPHMLRLHRKPGEGWGISFENVLFDGLRPCTNECVFCFMRMLPEGMRPSLYVRDDDYRLSFLQGNFVTLTNISEAELERIVEQRLTPLNVSLHAIDAEVRRQLMGRNHARGLEVLERLLAAGIEFKAQIVLLPGVNDGAVLDQTLSWIAERAGILATGIVPYGYTKYAALQQGFDTPASARAVIEQFANWQPSSPPSAPTVQLADEFFLKAYPGKVLSKLPPAAYYKNYPLLEDGIGMLRSFADSFVPAAPTTTIITGTAFAAFLEELYQAHGAPLPHIVAVKNSFFGGNVDVAGLLTARDILATAQTTAQTTAQKERPLFATITLPPTLFNDDGLTLDNLSEAELRAALKASMATPQ